MYNKNVAGQFIYFQGIDSTTGGIKSGVTWTVRRYIDGTAAAGGGTVTEDGTTGWYKYAMSQADTNGNNLGFNFTGTGAVPQTINCTTDGGVPNVTFVNTSIATVTTVTNQLTAAQIATGVWQDATTGDFTAASSIGKSLYTSGIVPGGANGLLIAGSNAATTFNGLTTGALAATTITASGAVAFQSTFAVTTSTALGAVSGSTLTLSGAVAFQSTFAVTGATTLTGAVTSTNASNDIRLGATERTSIATAVWATVMDGTNTALQVMRGFIAALLGKSSGLDLGTPTYRNIADTKSVITSTADASGNRATVTLDLT